MSGVYVTVDTLIVLCNFLRLKIHVSHWLNPNCTLLSIQLETISQIGAILVSYAPSSLHSKRLLECFHTEEISLSFHHLCELKKSKQESSLTMHQ